MDLKLYDVCRACMSNQRDCLDSVVVDFTKMSDRIVEMFSFCTSIEVLKEDGLPLIICQQCVDSVQTCYNFINICKSTDKALKHYLEQSKVTKKCEKLLEMKVEEEVVTKVKEEVEYYNDDDNCDDFKSDVADNSSEDEKIVDIKLKIDYQLKQINNNIKQKKVLNKKRKVFKKKRKNKETSNSVKEEIPNLKCDEAIVKTPPCEGVNKFQHKKSYTCVKCSETIVGLSAFNKHKRDVHLEYKVYTCDGCDKTFEKHRSMVSHLKVHDRPYKCKICPDDFKRKDKLKLHIIMCHTTERPFKCALCPLSFKTKEYLKIHNFLHEGDKRYLCEYCGASFNSAQSGTLKIHIRTHTGEKPYHCKECPKKFRTIHQLYKHERTHANMRTYKCSFCHKGFNHRSSMTVHERLHTGERPYKCEYCPRAFIDNWKRKSHLVSAHNIPRENIHCGAPGKKSKYYQSENQEHAQIISKTA